MAAGTDRGSLYSFVPLNNSTTPVGTTQKNMIPSHPHTTQKYQELRGTPTVPLCEPRNRPSTATKERGGGCWENGLPCHLPPQTNFLPAFAPCSWDARMCIAVLWNTHPVAV